MAKKKTKRTITGLYGNYSEDIIDQFNNLGIKPGDRLALKVKSKSIEGNLLAQSDLGDPSSIQLKLSNGYNVGIKVDDSMELSKLEGSVELEHFNTRIPKQKKGLPRIALLSTGGTIASRIDYKTGGVVMAMEPEEIFASLPELFSEVSFSEVRSLFNYASEDLGPNQWSEMAKSTAEVINSGVRGVAISHGTDTMGYSAAAMSFMLPDVPVPVVLTGAQRSTDRGSFDGAFNLISSARIAGNSNFAGVYVVMHETSDDSFCQVSRGTKVRKMHTTRRDAFKTVNDTPVARIDEIGNLEIFQSDIPKRRDAGVEPMMGFEPKVALLKSYPGMFPDIVDNLIDRGYRGIILEGTGLGHVSTFPPEKDRDLLKSLRRAIDDGIYIGMTSQCLNGRVHPYVYRATRTTMSIGVQYLEDMLPETAYIKIGWVLGNFSPEETREKMLTNMAGEMSSQSFYGEYTL